MVDPSSADIPVYGPSGAAIQTLDADHLFTKMIIETIPDYESMTPIERARALRRYAYVTIPLAGVKDFLVNQEVNGTSLEYAYRLFEQQAAGLWCGGTAQLLVKLYKAAGFNAWVYSFGRTGLLTHATTLVAVEGEVYLQDAYFNFEHAGTEGRPLPFLTALQEIARRTPPTLAADVAPKIAYFRTVTSARTWAGQYLSQLDPKAMDGGGFKCEIPITLKAFLDVFYLMKESYDFLESRGWPRQVDYLFLYPMYMSSLYPEGIPEAKALCKEISAIAPSLDD